MLGQMMDQPLLISSLIEHALRCHGRTEIVSVETTNALEVTNWFEVALNARRLGSVLKKMGLPVEARCGTIAWKNRRPLEIYFGTAGAGLIYHTLNPRLHHDQMAYIVNDAEDKILFFGRTFLTAVAELKDLFGTVDHYVLLGAGDNDAPAIAAHYETWDELPVLVAVRAADVSESELLVFNDNKGAKWQVPDRVTFVEERPLGATGKVVKLKLREAYADILLGNTI